MNDAIPERFETQDGLSVPVYEVLDALELAIERKEVTVIYQNGRREKVILSESSNRFSLTATTAKGYHETYYEYNDYGTLFAVVMEIEV